MFHSRPAPSMSLLAAGVVAGVVAAGCSRDAASSGATVRATDSAPPIAEASMAMPAPDTPPAAAAPRTPVGHPVPKPPTRDSPAKRPAQDKSLSYDPATNTVTFELVGGPFTFNGYRNGEGTLTVPPKANMVINFVNKDGTPHSAIVISGDGPIPNAASDPAIPRAYTTSVLQGLPQEAGDAMRFPMPESGTYRIFCGVPGHGLSGMWIWLKVDPAAKAPSFGPTKG